jgi:predicted Zn-dependent peptidase
MGLDEIFKSISAVNSTDIKEIASDFLTKTPTLALVGPFKSESKFEKVLSA